jgi:hypothetical protein
MSTEMSMCIRFALDFLAGQAKAAISPTATGK